LRDVEVELFAAGHADVEAVALNCFIDALRVNGENLLRALKRCIVQRRTVDRAKHGLLFLGQRSGRTGEKCRGKKFYVRHVIGPYDAPTQTRAAVGDAPAFLVAGKLSVQDDGA
jgi:hypothetical protein